MKMSEEKKAQIKKALMTFVKATGVAMGTCAINIVTIICNPDIVQTIMGIFK